MRLTPIMGMRRLIITAAASAIGITIGHIGTAANMIAGGTGTGKG